MARYSIMPYEIQKTFKNKCCCSITVNAFKKLTSLMKKHCICIIIYWLQYITTYMVEDHQFLQLQPDQYVKYHLKEYN